MRLQFNFDLNSQSPLMNLDVNVLNMDYVFKIDF